MTLLVDVSLTSFLKNETRRTKNTYAYLFSKESDNDNPLNAFKEIIKKGDPNGVFVALKIDVVKGGDRKHYFNFDGPSILRMYRRSKIIKHNITTSEKENPPDRVLFCYRNEVAMYYFHNREADLLPDNWSKTASNFYSKRKINVR